MSNNPLALVTGATNGIGLALATEFARHQYDLVIVARDPSSLEQTRQSLAQTYGVEVHAFSADLSVYDDVEKLKADVDEAGLRIDALVINAGRGLGGAFIGGTELRKELELIRLNVDSYVHLSKLFIPQLVEKGKGHVLMTSSISATSPVPFEAVYGASKAFINAFFYAIRNELQGTGVAMTLLMPGPTETDFFKKAGQSRTKVGTMKKDDPAQVARRAWYALMTGHEFVYGSDEAEHEGEVLNRMMSESHKAQRHRLLSEPGSADNANDPGK